MDVIRAFIAIDLIPELRKQLEQVSSELRQRLKDVPVRWVRVDNIHLTLKFLGDVSQANLEVLKKILQAESAGYTPFEISIGELGAFPSIHRPRVIWVKVAGPAELKALQHSIETETTRLGYAQEERPFSPHLTLGRVSRSATAADVRRIGEILGTYQVGFLGAMRVNAVQLYRSDLRPSGAVYTTLLTAPFSQG